jgi:hypothetical protein
VKVSRSVLVRKKQRTLISGGIRLSCISYFPETIIRYSRKVLLNIVHRHLHYYTILTERKIFRVQSGFFALFNGNSAVIGALS